MNTNTTRRALLGGVGLAGAALVAPALAAVASATPDRSTWNAALAKRDRVLFEWNVKLDDFHRAQVA